MKELAFSITLMEEMLGTKPANPEVFGEWVGSLAPKPELANEEQVVAQQMADAEKAERAGTTVFHTDEKGPFIWDYQIKGFFKDACRSMREADDSVSAKLKAYKTKIDGLVFVFPRRIYAQIADGARLGICERPLRAETMQGPRVSLARSHTLPEGTSFQFTVVLLRKDMDPFILEWMEYGAMRGLGQWRNSGKGRFSFRLLSQSAKAK